MRPNIGIVNALIRITCGFTMVAWGTAKLVKRPSCMRSLLIVMLGGMKIGEGITRFCPITALYEEKQDQKVEETLTKIVNPS